MNFKPYCYALLIGSALLLRPQADIKTSRLLQEESSIELALTPSTIKPAATIEGIVVEENTSTPVAGARVILQGADVDQVPHSPSSVTGADGQFRLTGLGAGHYTLHAIIGTNQLADWVCKPVTATVEAGSTNNNVKMTACRGGVVELTVRNHSNQLPVQDASVHVPISQFQVKTSQEGIARLRLRPGRHEVSVFKDGLGSQLLDISVEDGQTNQLPVALLPDRIISGAVTDPAGKPAPHIRIAAIAFPQGQTRSEADGQFTLRLIHSAYDGAVNYPLDCVLAAFDPGRNLAATVSIAEESTNATIKLEPGLILAGQVLDTTRQSITHALINLMIHTERHRIDLGSSGQADTEGRFEIKGLPRNCRYRVNALAKGFGQEDRNIEARETSVPRIELAPFHLPIADQRIAGVVMDDNDNPVAGVSVTAFGDNQPPHHTQTDVKGRFSFRQVCAGKLRLFASNPITHGRGGTRVESGDTNILLRLAYTRRADQPAASDLIRISGKVADPGGQPAVKALVRLFPFSENDTPTDEQGCFKLTCQQTISGDTQDLQRVLIARDPARNLAATLKVKPDTAHAELRLAPALVIAGRVTDVNNKPIAKANVILDLYAGDMSFQFLSPAQTFSDGSFEFIALPIRHRYNLRVSAPGYGRHRHALTPDETDTRIDLEPFRLVLADQRLAGVVVDQNDKPVSGASLRSSDYEQPDFMGLTDSRGRFYFDQVCPGILHLIVRSRPDAYANVTAHAGDTNLVIQLSSASGPLSTTPRRAGLKGKSLPDVTPLGFTVTDTPAGRPVLALLIDAEQRPSRRALKLVEDQAALFKDKGVAVLVIQAGAMAEDAFTAWKEEAALAFPIGRIQDKPEKARAAWGASALPWLILTDKDHRVVAESFAPEEIRARLQGLKQ